MEWIKQGLTEWRKANSALQVVTESADGIFNQLWEEIKEIVVAAVRLGISLTTNGSPLSRVVVMADSSFGDRLPSERKLAIVLAADRRSIVASSDAGEMPLKIEVCPDGVVCLIYSDRPITSREAAKEIMQRFIFKGDSPFRLRT